MRFVDDGNSRAGFFPGRNLESSVFGLPHNVRGFSSSRWFKNIFEIRKILLVLFQPAIMFSREHGRRLALLQEGAQPWLLQQPQRSSKGQMPRCHLPRAAMVPSAHTAHQELQETRVVIPELF